MTDETKKEEYKDTVFLPKTEFPMRGGLPQKEPEISTQWDKINLYEKLREKGKGQEKFVLHDGPPYANGNIHMGHAVNKILKDVIVKSQTMMGKESPYVPGWDCHGLPIEWKIEEKYRAEGKDKDEVDILSFREECRKFAQEWKDIQIGQFQRLGVTGDWDNPYLTMTNRAESIIVREIHKFALNGSLYKGLRPVMWSVVEKTALAEAEVEYKEHKSVTIWVKFPVVKTDSPLLEGASVVIWTTTPWTIPSNRAIAFGTDIEYGIYEYEGQKVVVATSLADSVREAAKIEEWDLIDTLTGNDIAGSICKHPLAKKDPYYDTFDVPLLAGDFVTDDAGTGFVHIAPGHGEDDFNLGRANEIEVTDNVTDDGKFRPHVGLFAGEEIYTQKGELGGGNFSVLRELADAGNLLAKGSLKHEYPHSWRSKAPLIFRTTPQWFIAMDGEHKIREKALKAIKDTGWHPAKGQARITAMIENRPDWCISRQRAWGVPIALFIHKDTGDVLSDEDVFQRIGDVFESEGSDAWWKDGAAQRFLGDNYKADDYTQIFDIVDVWFESGSTHAFCVEDTETWPCFEGVDQIDLYLEGSDQHRGWFHSSLLESVGTRGRAPYKNVLTHGFVLDEKGYKMSKSLGNVVDPLKMMEQYGADIIRLWVMLSDYNEDIRIGKDTIKNTSDLYRRMRNTYRFLLGALDGFTAEERVDLTDENVPELEQYMLHELTQMDGFVRNAIENYEYGKLAKMLHDFCNQELSAFYFDIRKDRLYCDRTDSFERRACRTVMAEIFSCLSSWLAPILSFTSEEAWSHRPEGVFEDAESVHLRNFPEVPANWKNAQLSGNFTPYKQIRRVVLGALEIRRQNNEIGSSLEAKPIVYVDPALATSLRNSFNEKRIEEFCIVSSVRLIAGETPQDAFKIDSIPTVGVVFEKAEGEKCERCWKVLPEVDAETKLCNRCTDAVEFHSKKTKAA